jgi:beta-lactamase regulating signal transducer with metallopeptidase domain
MIPLSSQSIALIQLLLDAFVKSAIILSAAGLFAASLRKSSAASRHMVWSMAIISLLALPVLSIALPSWRIPALPSLATVVSIDEGIRESANSGKGDVSAELEYKREVVVPALTQRSTFDTTSGARFDVRSKSSVSGAVSPAVGRASESAPLVRNSIDWKLVLLCVWLIGALLVIARLAAATARVWFLTRQAQRITESSWVALARTLADRLGLRQSVRIFKTERIPLPMTWGVMRSVVLLPEDAEKWPEECRQIVLLHELTHVKRRDCLMQTLAQLACALYWFNPLVWTAAWRLRVEREVACDDHVLESGAKASDYAGHLVEIASAFRATTHSSPVAVGMACSQLESRVRSILNPNARRRGVNGLKMALAAVIAVLITASLAMLQPWQGAEASARKGENAIPSFSLASPGVSIFSGGNSAERNQVEGASAQDQAQGAEQPEPQEQEQSQAQSQAQSKVQFGDQQQQNGDGAGWIGQGQGNGQGEGQGAGQGQGKSGDLTIDQLIQMRSVGVTPEYIDSIRKLGYSDLTVKQAIDLRAVGVNEEFVKQARGWTNGTPSIHDLVELRAIGMSSDFINGMKQAGFDNLPMKKLIEMRAVGVTPDYVASMRRLGFDNLTADKIVNLRAMGVTEAFVNEAQGWGFGKLSLDELIEIKAMGVSPEYGRSMKALGFENLTLREMIEMKAVGVNADYVKQMRELGFDKLTLRQLIETKAVGVTPEYVKKMRAAGLKNVSINELIEFKATGVDKILTKEKR